VNPATPTSLSAEAIAIEAAIGADGAHATDVSVIEVGPILSICDYFVLCSTSNTRLVASVAQRVEDHVAEACDRRPKAVEGLDERRWVLLDYGDVVVHVFLDTEREFYRLDRLYGDARKVEVTFPANAPLA
jgi:ribosome-associated protein